jgi:rhomboid protease GluP
MDWRTFFDRLGLNGVAWQWRIIRWQNAWANRVERWRGGRQHVVYQHKVCPHCGALVDRGDAACMRCGTAVGSWRGQAFMRTLGLVLPAWCPLTALLMGANIVWFALTVLLFGLRGLIEPDPATLVQMGALVPRFFWQGAYWQLITYGYEHGGLLHIVFNMVTLSQVGPFLERQFGGKRFFTVYTLALIGGGLADVLFRGGAVIMIVGASGALFGLIGLGTSFAHFYGGAQGHEQRNFFLKWALYGFVFGALVGADNVAHAGGFVVGAALGWVLEREQRRGGARAGRVWTAAAAGLAVLTLAAFIWMLLARLA